MIGEEAVIDAKGDGGRGIAAAVHGEPGAEVLIVDALIAVVDEVVTNHADDNGEECIDKNDRAAELVVPAIG